MLILFDHVTPSSIARFLPGHTVTKAKDQGWDTLANGDLLAEAERAGFDEEDEDPDHAMERRLERSRRHSHGEGRQTTSVAPKC